jgi:uncharacterized protein
MKKIIKIIIYALIVLGLLAGILLSARKVIANTYPQYTGYVNDFANVLSSDTKSKLEKEISDYDKKTTNQIAVATIKTTGDETIEEYGIHLFDAWKPGQKGKDNGVIFLTAVQDHHLRIEVGRGIEGELTDVQAKHIIDQVTPYYKQNDFNGGITKGVELIISDLSGTATASASPTASHSDIPGWVAIVIVVLIFGVPIALSLGSEGGSSDDSGDGESGIGTGVLGGIIGGSDDNDDDSGEDSGGEESGGDDDGGSFGGFGGGVASGGGASGSW